MTQTGKKFIRNGDFCEVVSDKFVEEGIKRGHVVYVAGHKALPISEEDPYTQRIKFFVHVYNPHMYEMSKEIYLMDPNSLQRHDDDTSARLLKEFKHANGVD
jgi:hypothetical protein